MMIMKYIEDIDVFNKNVILRLDLNVTIKEGKILDDTKIKKSIPTIEYLLDHDANILIMSHLGKIKNEEDKKNNSLKIVSDALSALMEFPINFIPETRGDKLKNAFSNRISMMENTRFEDCPNKLESGCDKELAKYWASCADVFINDAFGTTHRKHASNYGLAELLPSAYGFLVAEELNGLSPLVKDIKKPFSVIMGGAKVDDKIALIEELLKECDYLLVGGGIANTFLIASGYEIGSSLYSSEFVSTVQKFLELYPTKILLPLDVVATSAKGTNQYSVESIPDDACIYDIGPRTIAKYKEVLTNSKTIFLNGTMGKYEEPEYRNGTEELYKVLANLDSIVIAGGGDALASVNKLGYQNAFSFLSTGGGASLEYLATKELASFVREK